MNINSHVSIQINDTTVILEGQRKNLFTHTIIKIVNPRNETLIADESVLGIYAKPGSKKNFRTVILLIVNFFMAKDQMTKEVENDLRKLVNQNRYKDTIETSINEFKDKLIAEYDHLNGIIINRKNVMVPVPNTLGVKIKLIFLFTSKYHYGFHLVISREENSFSLTRWRKLLNTNSIIKQITDWEETASQNKNSALFFESKIEAKGYLISNKAAINALLIDINDYTKKLFN